MSARVAVIGLGSMGLGMALATMRAGHAVIGVEPDPARADSFKKAGGEVVATPALAAQHAEVVVTAVVNAAQTEFVLLGRDGALETLAAGAVVIAAATVPPAEAERLGSLVEAEGVHYLDAPMSGGAAKAATGELTFMASGSEAAFDRASPALDAMAAKVYRLGDRPGPGSAVKLVNQLLAGVHIAAACEAMALGAKLGLDLGTLYEVISNSAGSSWMFQNRVPHILDGDYGPKSAIGIFTKDLGIVQDVARRENFPVPIAGSALQMFLMAAAAGMAGDDDSSLVRVYQKLSGFALPGDDG